MSKKIVITLSIIIALSLPILFVGSGSLRDRFVANAFTAVFGGQILYVVSCTCTGGFVISVCLPRAWRMHFVPGFSQLFEYGQASKIGAWVLGTGVPPSPCLKRVWAGKAHFCIPIPHDWDIQLIGTSR